MEAIILAGGFGTRLRAVVPDVPKPMAPIGERPFLEILLSQLAQAGFQRVVLALGYKAEMIQEHFGSDYAGIKLVYAIENKPLGTGGAIRQALEYCLADHVFIFNGDTYLDLEVSQVEACWQQFRDPIIVARPVLDTARYGRVESELGRFIGFSEKGAGGPGLINAGCYIFPRTLLHAFESGSPFSLETDFLAKAVHEIDFRVFVTKGHFIDIGVPEDYARAQIELAGLV